MFAEIRASVSEFALRMSEARAELSKTEHAGEQHSSKMASLGKAAAAGMVGMAGAGGGFALEMADRFEASHARLKAAVEASGQSMGTLTPVIKSVSKQMENLGFSNAQTEEA